MRYAPMRRRAELGAVVAPSGAAPWFQRRPRPLAAGSPIKQGFNRPFLAHIDFSPKQHAFRWPGARRRPHWIAGTMTVWTTATGCTEHSRRRPGATTDGAACRPMPDRCLSLSPLRYDSRAVTGRSATLGTAAPLIWKILTDGLRYVSCGGGIGRDRRTGCDIGGYTHAHFSMAST